MAQQNHDNGKPDDAVVSQLKMESKAHMPLQNSVSKSESKWNTKNLLARIGADVVSAAAAASLVAPLISIIDRSVPIHT